MPKLGLKCNVCGKKQVDCTCIEEPMWKIEFRKVKPCPQRQDAVLDQLKDLVAVANRLGFYDASDFIYNNSLFDA